MSEGVLFYAEQDVQQGAADPGVGKLWFSEDRRRNSR